MMGWLIWILTGRGISKSWKLGSGYDHAAWKRKMLKKYKDACKAAVKDPDLVKSDVDGDGDLDTKCNWGVQQICKKMGYDAFDGKIANQICSLLEVDPEWHLSQPDVCIDMIKKGTAIAIAAIEGDANGHVAMIYPADLGKSGKWKSDKVPLVANIGNKNGIMGANYAFRKEPSYYYRELKQ